MGMRVPHFDHRDVVALADSAVDGPTFMVWREADGTITDRKESAWVVQGELYATADNLTDALIYGRRHQGEIAPDRNQHWYRVRDGVDVDFDHDGDIISFNGVPVGYIARHRVPRRVARRVEDRLEEATYVG